MALAIDSQEVSATGHASATSPLSYTFTNTAGTLLIVATIATAGSGTPTVTGVTYNGVSMSAVGNVKYDISRTALYLWSLVSPATGANTISVTATGSPSDILAAAISFTGQRATTPVGTPVSASDTSGTSTTATVNVTGTTSGSYVVSAVATGSGVTSANSPTVLSAKKNASTGTSGDNLGLGDQTTSGGTVTAAMTVTADQWGIIAAEIFAAPSAGTKAIINTFGW